MGVTVPDSPDQPAVPRLVLIGGGPSSLCVLMQMAELVRLPGADRTGQERCEVVFVDRAGETGGGAPHAATVSAALLFNDSITETDASGLGLVAWLIANRTRWQACSSLPATRARPAGSNVTGRRSTGTSSATLFLPRIVFGQFLRERWAKL